MESTEHPFRPAEAGDEQNGFDDGFGQRGYRGSEAEDIEDYERGFESGAYSLLEAIHPGLSEATADMHVNGKSSSEDTIYWLFAKADYKLKWARADELEGYEGVLKSGSTMYTKEDPKEGLGEDQLPSF